MFNAPQTRGRPTTYGNATQVKKRARSNGPAEIQRTLTATTTSACLVTLCRGHDVLYTDFGTRIILVFKYRDAGCRLFRVWLWSKFSIVFYHPFSASSRIPRHRPNLQTVTCRLLKKWPEKDFYNSQATTENSIGSDTWVFSFVIGN